MTTAEQTAEQPAAAPSPGQAQVAQLAATPVAEKVLRRTLPAASETAKQQHDAVAEAASQWSPQDITEAKAHCDVVLKGVEAVTLPEEPIKHGQCGAPAVVKLMSIGRSPEVVLSPPAIVTCDMVAALHKWFKNDVQRLARTHLGGSVVKIETMSSYSCRNAYGRRRTNLSEHGRANAVDIGGFVTTVASRSNPSQEAVAADTTRVLTSWGSTAREVRALAAKSEAAKTAAARASGSSVAATKPATTGPAVVGSPVITGSTTRSASGGSSEGSSGAQSSPAHVPGIIVRMPGQDLGGMSGFGLASPNHLGGAKSDQTAATKAKTATGARQVTETDRTQFLHEAHATACKYFGTVLGPEANNDHNNHFHVDMAPRKSGNFCE